MAFFSGIVAYTKSTIDRATSFVADFFPAKKRQVAVLDNELLNSIFGNFNILEAELIEDKSVASHPLEINTYLQDNVVHMPKTVTITVAAEAAQVADLYQLLETMYNDPNVLFAVELDGQVHRNMLFKTKPVRRDASKFDVIEVPLVFHEFIFSRVKVSALSDPSNAELKQYSDRQQTGFQKGSTISGQDEINREAQRTVPVRG